MEPRILDEFAVPSYEQWLQVVEQQLKGAPFDKKLVTHTLEGISIQPIYRKADPLKRPVQVPGSFPYRRNTKLTGNIENGWQITQHYGYPDPEAFNQAVVYDLARGLNTVSFSLDLASGKGIDPDQDLQELTGRAGVSIFEKDDLQKALQAVDLSTTALLIRPHRAYLPLFALLIDFLDSQKINRNVLKGNLVADPLAELACKGDLSSSLDKAYAEMAACVLWSTVNTPQFKTLGIDLCPYGDAGASATQELAFALATGVEYLRALQARGLDIDTIAGNMEFHLGIGSDFFMNIAKIRAARTLWSQVVASCGGSADVQKLKLHASTTRYNKTLFDPHVNLLRATTEAYAAVLAGCDSVTVAPFDDVFSLPDELSRRISRNIQMVLKEECHGHKIIDPGGGAWFLEELTDQLAEKSWGLFQDIEKQGGMAQALLQGKIQQSVVEVATKRSEEVAQRKKVIVGTNQYSNQDEQLPTARNIDLGEFASKRSIQATRSKSGLSLESEIAAIAVNPDSKDENLFDSILGLAKKGATLGQLSQALFRDTGEALTADALPSDRLASAYESLRQKAAAYKTTHGELPQILLVNMGPLKQHKARADFSTGFLQPGGFEVKGSNGFNSLDEAVTATLAATANVAVLCSTDDTYPELVPEFVDRVKKGRPDMMLVLAGYPIDHVDAFRQAGIDDFIHLKANNLKLLKMLQSKAGVSS